MLFLLFSKVLKLDYKTIDNVIINKIKNLIVSICSASHKVRYYSSFMRWISLSINPIRIFAKFNYRYKFVYYSSSNNDFGVSSVSSTSPSDIPNFSLNLRSISSLICGFSFKYILTFSLPWPIRSPL